MCEQSELFERESAEAHGKSVEALRFSRDKRTEILRMFDGDLPMSIMTVRREKRNDVEAENSYTETMGKYTAKDRDEVASESHKQELDKAFSMSSSGCAYGALSQFHANICRAMLRLYTKAGDIVVDPFAGHNSRMEFTVSEGRHYHGYDISERFMRENFKLQAVLRRKYLMSIELFHQDSRELKYTDDEYGDFTITSPPYYDIEDYGDEAEQLGKAKTYTQFLEGMQDVLCENFRVLKPGAFCIYFINDFRRKGTFHTYYSDIIDMMRAARFTVHDVLVVDMGFPMTAAFASQIVERKILPKRHEYGIIAVKKGD